MPLTKADKAWIAATVRRIVEEVYDGKPLEHVGAYDGLHDYVDDLDVGGKRRRRRTVLGFVRSRFTNGGR